MKERELKGLLEKFSMIIHSTINLRYHLWKESYLVRRKLDYGWSEAQDNTFTTWWS
jgi:hypothetical protein